MKHYDHSQWKRVKLGDVGRFIAGSAFPLRFQGQHTGDLPFLKVSDFSLQKNTNAFCIANNYVSMNTASLLNCSIVPVGSVIFAKIGAAIALERKRTNKSNVCIDNNMMAFVPDTVDSDFICNLFQNIKLSSYTSATALPSLSAKELKNIAILLPHIEDQEKISHTLNTINSHIANLESLISKQEAIKKTTEFLLLQPRDTWHTVRVSECLDYEQPGKYIVHTDVLSAGHNIPVLTANKSFIIGYTEELDNVYDKGAVILYDDFTMDMKYVNFAFKVKSSAIKLLTPKAGYDLYFVYFLLKKMKLSQQEHARSYISKVERMYIEVPDLYEQKRIAAQLRALDEYIENLKHQLTKQRTTKQSLMDYFFGN